MHRSMRSRTGARYFVPHAIWLRKLTYFDRSVSSVKLHGLNGRIGSRDRTMHSLEGWQRPWWLFPAHLQSHTRKHTDPSHNISLTPFTVKFPYFHLVRVCNVQTAPSGPKEKYGRRRQAIRHTYLKNLTAMATVEAKFVVGRSMEQHTAAALEQEVARSPQLYMQLDVEVAFLHMKYAHLVQLPFMRSAGALPGGCFFLFYQP